MRTVTVGVAGLDAMSARLDRALAGEPQGAFLSFESPEMLWRVLTARRWAILRAMTGAGPLSVREVARRVGRDVKAVHGDVTALIDAGIIERAGRGVVFPWDAIHVDFTLQAAAAA